MKGFAVILVISTVVALCSSFSIGQPALKASALPLCPKEDPAKPPAHFPDPDDCQNYYTCSWGRPIQQSCPGELVWNQIVESCDYADNVDCGA